MMNIDKQLEDRINNFMERKQEQIPELRQSPTRLYRKLVAEDRRDNARELELVTEEHSTQWRLSAPMKFASF